MGCPLIENRLELSGIRPFPCVARTNGTERRWQQQSHDPGAKLTFSTKIGLAALAEFAFPTLYFPRD